MTDRSIINLHVYPSPCTHETRILRETKSLAEACSFDRIVIAALWEEGLPEREVLDEKREIRRFRARGHSRGGGLPEKLARHLDWQIRIFRAFRSKPVGVLSCHALSVLPLAILFKGVLRSRVVYDTHELETETMGNAGMRKPLSRMVERFCLPRADALIVVNESIARWYKTTYRFDNLYVVRNIPVYRDLPTPNGQVNLLRKEFGIPDGDLLFLYHGLIDEGRSIPLLLRTFKRLPPSRHIVFMGYGSLVEAVTRESVRSANIHYHPAVEPGRVLDYVGFADAGICLIENACLSYYLSLPNKLFECIMAGVPVIVSDFPEMRRLVEEGNCGWQIAVSEQALFNHLQAITEADLRKKRRDLNAYRKSLDWRNEETALLRAYRCIPGSSAPDVGNCKG